MAVRRTVFLAVIHLVFFLSGFAALIYQVVWQRALTLYYGVGAVSTSIVVSVFLFGLGAGSYWGGWLAERSGRWRVAVYVVLEAALGAMGAFSLDALQAANPYLSRAGYVQGFLIIAALIALPTVTMGMTLPLIVKITNRVRSDYGQTISELYCVNTLGAAAGALLGAYWLISFHGLQAAVYVAGAINLFVAVAVLAVSRLATVEAAPSSGEPARPATGLFTPSQAALIVFVTGFLAIGYQMIWFRVVGTLLKPSAYVFSTVLFVYLLGIALGSHAMAVWLRRGGLQRNPASAFFVVNAGIAVYIALTFVAFFAWDNPVSRWMMTTTFAEQLHPPYNVRYALSGNTPAAYWTSVYLLLDLFLWPVMLLLPATLLMGASFPLINVLVLQDERREGYSTGLIYALTVAGNVAGGLLTGFVLMPLLSTETTLRLFVGAGLLWVLGIRRFGSRSLSREVRLGTAAALTGASLAVMPARHEFFDKMHPRANESLRIVTEGRDGVVVSMSGTQKDGREFARVYIGGSHHASFPSSAFEVEVLETFTHARKLDNVLIIGFGGGNLTAAVLRLPEVKSVTVVEIADTLLDNLKRIPFYQPIFSDPRLTLVVDDGRRYLQRHDRTYDLVFMDPLHSTTAYSNNIYSKEFFELVRSRLAPGGVQMTWMNEYMIIPRTLAFVYPEMKCFYYFCLSSNAPLAYDNERRGRFLAQVDPLMRTEMHTRMKVDHYLTGDRAFMLERTKRYPLNTDFQPITEYYFGYTNRGF